MIKRYQPLVASQLGKKATLLIVDDDTINIDFLINILAPLYTVLSANCGKDAIKQCMSTLPDLVLLDIEMPEMDGYQTCQRLKDDPITRDIPVIFITGHEGADRQDACWEAGCVDFIQKSFTAKTLLHRVKAHLNLKFMADELRDMALKDGLTGLFNRRYFDQSLIEQKRLSARDKLPISLLMIDVDYFKLFNDTYGHLAGDYALQHVSQLLQQIASRPTDTVARFGGEEFAIILPNTDTKGAKIVAQHVLEQLNDAHIVHAGSPLGQLTVSIGISACEPSTSGFEELVHLADSAMYGAKKRGRNRFYTKKPQQ
jgi:diguanylate cyclase (GGDEF)-like protein